MHEVEDELKWAREALTVVENQNFRLDDAHKARFPTRYRHFLSQEWDESRLEDHISRLERDLSTARKRQ